MAYIMKNGAKVFLNTYPPETTTAHILTGQDCEELARLSIFRRDLERAEYWLDYRNDDPDVHAGLDEAALVCFCRCFEGTNGLRQRPLKQKDIFNAAQKEALRKLRLIRNKIVAHDEQILGGSYIIVIMNEARDTVGVEVLGIAPRFTSREVASSLRDLIKVARLWVEAEYKRFASQIATQNDRIPLADRVAAPPAVIKSTDHDLLHKLRISHHLLGLCGSRPYIVRKSRAKGSRWWR